MVVLLAPLLLVQGMLTRRRTPRLPEPDGARCGRQGSGATLRLLIVGDSAAAGVGVAHQDLALSGQLVNCLAANCTVDWQLEAATGAKTEHSIQRLREKPAEAFDVVVISLGVNDVTGLSRRRQFERLQKQLWLLLRKRFGANLIVVCGLPPMHRFPALPQPLRYVLGIRARQFTAVLQRAANSTQGTGFLEMDGDGDMSLIASDGFHPGAGVYSRWASGIADIVAGRYQRMQMSNAPQS